MGGSTPFALAGAIAVAGCLNIPPPPGSDDGPTPDAAVDADPCPPGDGDCDGWPAVSPINPAANDCDDGDPGINPGEIDDTGDGIDEDCIDGPFDGTGELAGTSFTAGRLITDILDLQFNTDTAMPSSMRIGGVESLHAEPGGCEVSNEEGLGISLYPAFAAHVRSDPMINGTVTVERVGPAMTTVLVAWAVDIPAGASGTACNQDVSLTANVRFSALPRGRLHRDDTVTVTGDADTTACSGCAASTTAPIFTSYVSLEPTMDQIQRNEGTPTSFTDFAMATPVLPRADNHRMCLSSTAGGDDRKLGVVWHFQPGGGEAGIRIKSTGTPSSSLVYDWRRSSGVQARTYQAITVMFAQLTGGPCSAEMWESMSELVTPANSGDVVFDYGRGLYVPSQPVVDRRLPFTLLGDMNQGMAVRLDMLGGSGLTVWADGVRRTAGTHYLVQRDADGAYIVWLPDATAGTEYVIAGPGGEPVPP